MKCKIIGAVAAPLLIAVIVAYRLIFVPSPHPNERTAPRNVAVESDGTGNTAQLQARSAKEDHQRNNSMAVKPFQMANPPLGPLTEQAFDAAIARLQQQESTGIPMRGGGRRICDLDGDSDCDADDSGVFQTASGKCLGNPGFIPEADVDLDECIGVRDRLLLFGGEISPTDKPDLDGDRKSIERQTPTPRPGDLHGRKVPLASWP